MVFAILVCQMIGLGFLSPGWAGTVETDFDPYAKTVGESKMDANGFSDDDSSFEFGQPSAPRRPVKTKPVSRVKNVKDVGDRVVQSPEIEMLRRMEQLGFKLRTADLQAGEVGSERGTEAAGDCVECGVGERAFKAQKVKRMGREDRIRIKNNANALNTPLVTCRFPEGTQAHGTGNIFSVKPGVLISAAHTLFESPSDISIREQKERALTYCFVEIRDINKKLVFSSRIKEIDVKDEFFLRQGNGSDAYDYVKRNTNDIVAIKLEETFPVGSEAQDFASFDSLGIHEGQGIGNIAYNAIPDDPSTTKVNEKYEGVTIGQGKIHRLDGGPGRHTRYSAMLFQHDVDTNGAASGSCLQAFRPADKRWVCIGFNIIGVGIDGREYNGIDQFNAGLKLTGEDLTRIRNFTQQ